MDDKNVPIYYSNNAQFIMSPKDFVVNFGVIVPDVELETNKVKNNINLQARVFMSPAQFKAFVTVAEKQLQAYEKQFGKIIDTLQKPKK